MASDAAHLVKKIGQVGTAVGRARKTSVVDMSLAGKDTLNAALKRQGVSRPGARSTRTKMRMPYAHFTMKGFQNPTSMLGYRGPAHWWESGTKPHKIGQGATRQRQRRIQGPSLSGRRLTATFDVTNTKAKRVSFGPGQVRTNVDHPGMRARPQWKTTKQLVKTAAPQVLRSGFRRNLAETTFGR